MSKTAKIEHIFKYPIKSLRGIKTTPDALSPYQRIRGDREYAFAYEGSPWHKTPNTWHPKQAFLNLAQNPWMARVSWQQVDDRFEISCDGKTTTVSVGNDLSAILPDDAKRNGVLVKGDGLTDEKDAWVSIASIASLHALGDFSMARFRPNIIVSGIPAFHEQTWIGKVITIDNIQFHIQEPTGRCLATHVSPKTGTRDFEMLKHLKSNLGHCNFGVFAHVLDVPSVPESFK